MIVSAPIPARVAVWPAAFVWPLTVKLATVKLPSTSESFVRTLPVTAASSSTPVTASGSATGASLTAVSVSVSVDVEVRLPSDSV